MWILSPDLWNAVNKRKQGFTLIETLTAMMILSVSLVTIFQLFSGGLHSEKLAEDYTRAVFYAAEKTEEMLLYTQMRDGEFAGDFGEGFRWEVSVSSLTSERDEKENIANPSVSDALFEIAVTVFWNTGKGEREYTVRTVHMAEKMDENT